MAGAAALCVRAERPLIDVRAGPLGGVMGVACWAQPAHLTNLRACPAGVLCGRPARLCAGHGVRVGGGAPGAAAHSGTAHPRESVRVGREQHQQQRTKPEQRDVPEAAHCADRCIRVRCRSDVPAHTPNGSLFSRA